jgi:membrane fusion protein (multidrug efflux system)
MADILTKSEPTLRETSGDMGTVTSQKNSVVPIKNADLPKVGKRKWLWIVGIIAAGAAGVYLIPWVREMLNTVSTDDAYVNGHVTYVAPRVSGQVVKVYVDDNNIVHKNDLLLELDKKPYEVQLHVAQAAFESANAALVAAKAQAAGLEAEVRSLQFTMQHAVEDVHNKTSELRATVAQLESSKALQIKAAADYKRALTLEKSNVGAISKQDLDKFHAASRVADAETEAALNKVRQIRVGLGLPAEPPSGDDLSQVPANLDQTFSGVREAQGKLMVAAASLGVTGPFTKLPNEMLQDFYSRYPGQNIDEIFETVLKNAPDVQVAQTKLEQAEANLEQAKLNLSYCTVYAEIDGAIIRRSVNPGNNVVPGQSVMAIRSIKEIWVDANFKETQLGKLRIGQPVKCEVDMYGKRHEFEGRITGFTMGTGQMLSLLPPQNATGNFVKIVQRLPVRIDLVDYDPEKDPLFVGLSVEPRVYYKEEPTGPGAGKYLQRLVDDPVKASEGERSPSPETKSAAR